MHWWRRHWTKCSSGKSRPAIRGLTSRIDEQRQEQAEAFEDHLRSGRALSGRLKALMTLETLRAPVFHDAISPSKHSAVLQDLFWTLYSKLAAVLEGHRVVYEVVRWISTVSRQSETKC